MRRALRILFEMLALTFAVGAGMQAQTAGVTTEVVPPQYPGVQVHVPGVFVTPIPNLPLTALVDISSMRVLPDGSTELRRTENHIARASNGSIYNERRMLVGVAYKGTPRLLSSHVYDPQTRVSTTWSPFTNVAQTITLPARPMAERKPFTVPVPGATDEDLGTSTLNGVTVRGLRRTRVVQTKVAGAAKDIHVLDEYWYSEDLHLIVLEKHNDPRTGEQIVTVLNVERAEPPAKLFQPPASYRVVDVTSTRTGGIEVDPFDPPIQQQHVQLQPGQGQAAESPSATQTVIVR